MHTRRIVLLLAIFTALTAGSISVQAQQPQIPTLQVCNKTRVAGRAIVQIQSRADAVSSGKFTVVIELKCDPADGYPGGTLEIRGISMSDSIAQGAVIGRTFEQVTTTGKHSPTVFLNGRCSHQSIRGCRYWLMIADNKGPSGQGTPDVISFLVFNGMGQRVAYGTGPVADGDIDVEDTPN